MALVKYGESSGTVISEQRIVNDSLGFSMPSAMTKDPAGNFVISGITTSNGTDFDILTVKVNNDFDVLWKEVYDSGSMMDSVSSVVCGPDSSIIVTGWCRNPQYGTEFLTLKYQQDGTLEWSKKRLVNPLSTISKSRVAAIDSNGNITIAGEMRNNIIVLQYKPTGDIIWEKVLRETSGKYIKPFTLLLGEDNSMFITSILTLENNDKTYSTYRLNSSIRHQEQVLDSLGKPVRLKGEIIVRFKPGIIKSSFIDNTDLRYGTIGEIFNDTACLELIADMLTADNFDEWIAVKIHRSMTTADSIATTRLGKVISIPDFYNTLVLLVPEEYQRIVGEIAISDTLQSNDLRCCIRFAEDNPVVTPDDCDPPDDPRYSIQANLHPTTDYPNGHINMEPAWCIAGAGSANVRVSIIDTGIRWSHEDFGDGTFAGSVIVDGKDYHTGAVDISSNNNNDVDNHGTKVASVVGSIRNNTLGVAGIAGGSGTADGVRLIAQRAFGAGVDKIVEAFADAANLFDAQIINCSGGFDPSPGLQVQYLAMREILHHANRMGIIVCASRGNFTIPADTPRFPGTIQDEWVICVGGTNTEGNFNPECRIGEPIDVAAPSRWQLTKSAENYQNGTTIPSDQGYGGISFTSGATPHATGLAAIMLSYYENSGTQLVQEDIEYIIQESATDVFVPPAEVGYDAQTGHGKIDAGAALQMIEMPACKVLHYGTNITPSYKTNQLIEEDVTIELTEPFTAENGQTFDKGTYTADIYKVNATILHPPNTSITHNWGRHSSSTVFKLYEESGGVNKLLPVEHVTFTGYSVQGYTNLEGYVYYVKNNPCTIEGWIPASPTGAHLAHSVITCPTTGTEEIAANSLQLFPNPASSQLTLSLAGGNLQESSVVLIYDFSGKLMASSVISSQNQMDGYLTFDISHFPQGIYTCVLRSHKEVITAKFTKF